MITRMRRFDEDVEIDNKGDSLARAHTYADARESQPPPGA